MKGLIFSFCIFLIFTGCSEEPVERVSPEEATEKLIHLVTLDNTRENLNKARQYIEMGADLSVHSEYTGRPIIYIAYINYQGRKFYDLLIESGAIDFYKPTMKICELIENRIDDAEAVKEYIKQGAYVNSDDLIEGHSWPIIESAVDSDMRAITKVLIQEGAGEPRDIIIALDAGLKDMSQLILDSFEFSDENFNEALGLALPYPEILQMIIDHGADPNFPLRKANLWLPLHNAMDVNSKYSKSNKEAIEQSIKILLEAGANPNRSPSIISKEDLLVMQEAFRRYYSGESVGDINRLWSLDSTGDATSIDDYNHLIRKQNAGIWGGSPPITMAININNTTIARMLLEAKADPDRMGPADSVPPLMKAVYKNSPEMVDLLLEYGADPNTAEIRGGALSLAVSKGSVPITNRLLQAGADPNVQRPGGVTPLMDGVTLKNKQIIKALLEAGADPLIPDEKGTTALQMSKDLGLNDIVPLMEQNDVQ